MNELITYFKNKKNLINLLILAILVVGLPVTTDLIKTSKIFNSRAVSDPIVFSGPNVVTGANNQKVLKLNEQGKAIVDLELTSTLGPPATQQQAQLPSNPSLADATPDIKGLAMSLVPKGGLVKEAKAQSGCQLYDGVCWGTQPGDCSDDPDYDAGPGLCWAQCAASACGSSGGNACQYGSCSGEGTCDQGWECQSGCWEYNQCGGGGGNSCQYGSCSGEGTCDQGWECQSGCWEYNQCSGSGGNTCQYGGCTGEGTCDQGWECQNNCWEYNQCGGGGNSGCSFQGEGCTLPNNQDGTCDVNLECSLSEGDICDPNNDFCPVDSPCSWDGSQNTCQPSDGGTGGQTTCSTSGDSNYCNNPNNNGGEDTGGIYSCSPDDDGDFGDGCYVNKNVCAQYLVSRTCDATAGYSNIVCMNSDQSVTPTGCFTGVTNCYADTASYFAGSELGQAETDQCPVSNPVTGCVLSAIGEDDTNADPGIIDIVVGKSITWQIAKVPPGTQASWIGTNQDSTTNNTVTQINDAITDYPNRQNGWARQLGPYDKAGNYTRQAVVDGATCTVSNVPSNTITVHITGSSDKPTVTGITPEQPNSQAQPYAPSSTHTVGVNFTTPNSTGHADLYYFGPFPVSNDPNTLNAGNIGTSHRIVDGLTQTGQNSSWHLPTQVGKYYYAVNAHTTPTANHDQNDWNTSSPVFDVGCAWDSKVYRQTGQTTPPGCTVGTAGCNPILEPTGDTCLNSGLMPFYIGTVAPTPSPTPANNCGNAAVCPGNPAICSNNAACPNNGNCPTGQIRCSNNQCATSCGGTGGPVVTPNPNPNPTPLPSNNACPVGQTRCANGQCATSCVGVTPNPTTAPSGNACPVGQTRCVNGQCALSCVGVTPTPTSHPAGTFKTVSFKIAEDPVALNTAQSFQYNTEPVRITYPFINSTPGVKTIWVEYLASDGTTTKTDRRTASITLLGPEPAISGCGISTDGGTTTFNITGANFGSESGTLKSGQNSLTITQWTATGIKATLGSAPTGQVFPVLLTRKDGQTTTGQCGALSGLALGAKLFCRQPGRFDVAGVNLTLVEASSGGRLVREVVTIDKEGIVQGLKSKIEEGKRYKIGIDAPKSVRRVVNIVGANGITNVPNLILPIGDIFPLGPGDGAINTLDKGELNREWVISVDAKDRAGDFNQDLRVNSIDWACQRFDFGKTDDPEPQPGS